MRRRQGYPKADGSLLLLLLFWIALVEVMREPGVRDDHDIPAQFSQVEERARVDVGDRLFVVGAVHDAERGRPQHRVAGGRGLGQQRGVMGSSDQRAQCLDAEWTGVIDADALRAERHRLTVVYIKKIC